MVERRCFAARSVSVRRRCRCRCRVCGMWIVDGARRGFNFVFSAQRPMPTCRPPSNTLVPLPWLPFASFGPWTLVGLRGRRPPDLAICVLNQTTWNVCRSKWTASSLLFLRLGGQTRGFSRSFSFLFLGSARVSVSLVFFSFWLLTSALFPLLSRFSLHSSFNRQARGVLSFSAFVSCYGVDLVLLPSLFYLGPIVSIALCGLTARPNTRSEPA